MLSEAEDYHEELLLAGGLPSVDLDRASTLGHVARRCYVSQHQSMVLLDQMSPNSNARCEARS